MLIQRFEHERMIFMSENNYRKDQLNEFAELQRELDEEMAEKLDKEMETIQAIMETQEKLSKDKAEALKEFDEEQETMQAMTEVQEELDKAALEAEPPQWLSDDVKAELNRLLWEGAPNGG